MLNLDYGETVELPSRMTPDNTLPLIRRIAAGQVIADKQGRLRQTTPTAEKTYAFALASRSAAEMLCGRVVQTLVLTLDDTSLLTDTERAALEEANDAIVAMIQSLTVICNTMPRLDKKGAA